MGGCKARGRGEARREPRRLARSLAAGWGCGACVRALAAGWGAPRGGDPGRAVISAAACMRCGPCMCDCDARRGAWRVRGGVRSAREAIARAGQLAAPTGMGCPVGSAWGPLPRSPGTRGAVGGSGARRRRRPLGSVRAAVIFGCCCGRESL